MESMLPAERSCEYSSKVSRRAASNCTEENTQQQLPKFTVAINPEKLPEYSHIR